MVQPATFQDRPGDPVTAQPGSEEFLPEGAGFIIDLMMRIYSAYESRSDWIPIFPQTFQLADVDRYTVIFHCRYGSHVPSALECLTKIDLRQEHGKQTFEGINVGGAIFENRGLLFPAPGTSAQDEVAHFVFLDGADTIQAKVRQGAD